MFDLVRPCVTCPFRRGQGSRFRLRPERLDDIYRAPSFQCHKTADYDEDGEGRAGDRPQQCAGLMAVLNRENAPNQIMQVAQRLGALDPSRLDPGSVAYANWADVLAAHKGIEG